MIKPLHDYVAVEPVVRQLSAVLWVDNRENYCQGLITAVGKKCSDQIKVGDLIIYGGEDYLNWKVMHFGERKFQVIQEADICCVVEN